MSEQKDREEQEFIKVVNEGLVPRLKESAYVASFVPTPSDIDAKFAVELGLSIMLDKPLLMIVKPGEPVPEKIRKVADCLVEADITTEAGREHIAAEIAAFTERMFPDDDTSDARPE